MAKPAFYYDNRFADATPAASTTAAGFAVANLTDWRRYTWWKPTAIPATVTVDCASPKAADYALIVGHNLAATGCTVQVRGSTDNFATSDVLVATNTPTTDRPLLVTFGSVSYRYWRLRFITGTAPSIAIAAIGAAFELPTWLEQGFDPIGRSVEGIRNANANGQPLGRVVDFEQWQQRLTLRAVSWSWLRNTFEPAWRAHLRASPFGFCWEPGSYASEVRLVAAGDDFGTPHQAGSLADLTLDLQGVVE